VCDTEGACTEQELTIETGGNITVFNALSPNNDGKNESLIIQYIDVLPTTQENTVTIYNRWGDEVWQGDNYDNTTVVFSGKSKSNNDLPTGIYFYKISLIIF